MTKHRRVCNKDWKTLYETLGSQVTLELKDSLRTCLYVDSWGSLTNIKKVIKRTE